MSWGCLGPSWAVLGASWDVLEGSCEHLGGILGHLGGILEASWDILGILEASIEDELNALSGEERLNQLWELNVLAQARNVSRTNIIRDAWSGGQGVNVHSWIYGLSNGMLKGLLDPPTS